MRLDMAPATKTAKGVQIAASESAVYVVWEDGRSPVSEIYFNIPFGLQSYGNATAGTGGIAPQLAATGTATLGNTPSLDVTDGLANAPGVLFLGTKTSAPVVGGTLLVLPALTLPLGLDPTGTASLPLGIPNDQAFVGGTINFQALFLDAGAPQSVSMTNGLETWIG